VPWNLVTQAKKGHFRDAKTSITYREGQDYGEGNRGAVSRKESGFNSKATRKRSSSASRSARIRNTSSTQRSKDEPSPSRGASFHHTEREKKRLIPLRDQVRRGEKSLEGESGVGGKKFLIGRRKGLHLGRERGSGR